MTRRPQRAGVTLMEVMIATAILAIGVLAIMALFPIGAVNMARAINQNRAADHAQNCDGLFRVYWKQAWIDPNRGGIRSHDDAINPLAVPPNPDWQMVAALDLNPTYGQIPATSSQPSFPVLIDPIGARTQVQFGPANVLNVAGLPTLPMRANFAATPAIGPYTATIRNTTMLDEFSYDRNGEPSALTGQLDRGGRYNAAWLIQRPKNNVPEQVNLTILVFAGRSPTDTPSAETPYQAVAQNYSPQVDPKPKSVLVDYTNKPRPGFLKGKWVAFTTTVQPQPALTAGGTGVPYPAFDFYRIAAVTDIDDVTINLEFEQPLRTYDLGNPPGGPASTLPGWVQTSAGPPITGTLSGSVIFFDNLFEVFDRGTVSASGIAGR